MIINSVLHCCCLLLRLLAHDLRRAFTQVPCHVCDSHLRPPHDASALEGAILLLCQCIADAKLLDLPSCVLGNGEHIVDASCTKWKTVDVALQSLTITLQIFDNV